MVTGKADTLNGDISFHRGGLLWGPAKKTIGTQQYSHLDSGLGKKTSTALSETWRGFRRQESC